MFLLKYNFVICCAQFLYHNIIKGSFNIFGMGGRKTDNDHLLAAAKPQLESGKQLNLFRVVYPQAEEPSVSPAEQNIWDKIKQDGDRWNAIARELFPDHVPGTKVADMPIERLWAIRREMNRRYPKPKPEPIEPCPLPKDEYKIFSVRWSNPYTQPPDGLPEVLLRFESNHDRPTVQQQRKIEAILSRFPGYCFATGFGNRKIDSGAYRWSEERKTKNRLRLLENRLQKKFTIPELYEAALQEAIAKKPEYYGVKPLQIPIDLKVPERELVKLQSLEETTHAL